MIISKQDPEKAYFWLYFSQHLFRLHPERTILQVFEKTQYPDILTPFQIIGREVVHYVHGFYQEHANHRLINQISVFCHGASHSDYFTKVFHDNLSRSKHCKALNAKNVGNYIRKYASLIPRESQERTQAFIKKILVKRGHSV